jgi:two-component system chemotaxis response regulator CheB
MPAPNVTGVLLQMKDNGLIRFRCHTGHADSAESLLDALSEGVEAALWGATRALEESALLIGQMAAHVRERHSGTTAAHFEERAAEAHRQAKLIRTFLLTVPAASSAEGS